LDLTPEDNQVLLDLKQRWDRRNIMDLEARYEMGAMVKNHYFTGNQKRAAHGKQVMTKAALLLRLDRGDLYRMVKFAETFKSVDDLRQQFPGVTIWSDVKDLLVMLNPKAGKKKNFVEKDADRAFVEETIASLKNFDKDMDKYADLMTPKDLRTLRLALASLDQRIVGIQIIVKNINEPPVDETEPDAEDEAAAETEPQAEDDAADENEPPAGKPAKS